MSTSIRAVVFTYQAVELDLTTHADQGRSVTTTLCIYDNWPCDVRAPSFVTNADYAEPWLGDGWGDGSICTNHDQRSSREYLLDPHSISVLV